MIYILNKMDKREQFEYAMKKTEVVRPAKHSLYTFSSTTINYTIVSELAEKIFVEVRKGKMTVEKPMVIAPPSFVDDYLEGFDADQAEYIQMMLKKFGLRALRYKYRNETKDVKLISGRLESVLDRIKREVDAKEDNLAAIIKGVPELWGISLMKCAVELITGSFPSNVKELEERGWFNY